MATIESSDQNFETDVLQESGIVLVDFWASWCGPCKMIAPVLEEISNEKGDIVKIVKINVDEHPETPTTYNVRSIPTLALFKDGNLIDTKVGVHAKNALIQWIESHK
jgi:thioredoxin 1